MKQAPNDIFTLRQVDLSGWLDAMCFVQNKACRMGFHAMGAIGGCS
jgi:hypothetical protein